MPKRRGDRGATMTRLKRRPIMVWDRMGFPAIRHGLVMALLASFLSLFVLVSAVDAAVCGPEATISHTSEAATDAPAQPDDGGGSDSHVICSHCHCHHSGVTVAEASNVPATTLGAADLIALAPADGPPSHAPTGPDRPPRG